MGETHINYQQPLITESVLQTLLKDNGPRDVSEEFWDLMGPGLDTALLEEKDIKTLKERVKINVINILMKYPEYEWDNLYITEVIANNPGDPPTIKKHKIYPDLEDKLINKICLVKGTRGKNGNLLEKLTTSSSRVFSENMINQQQYSFTPPEEKKKGILSGWRK